MHLLYGKQRISQFLVQVGEKYLLFPISNYKRHQLCFVGPAVGHPALEPRVEPVREYDWR
jgi:hypothetical protein